MWLILANALDPAGPWLAAGLSARLFTPVIRITELDLGHAQIWEHFVDRDRSWFRLQLADGRWIDSHQITGVINRLHQSPFARMAAQHGPEHSYAVHEIAALLIGCLARANCLILNSPSGHGLNGDCRRPSEWRALATAAGLTVRSPFDQPPDRPLAATDADAGPTHQRLLIIAENLIHLGPADVVPPSIRGAAIRLAAAAQTPLLELHFRQDENAQWIFDRAQACADLLTAGDAALDAIASLVLNPPKSKTRYQNSCFSLSPFLPEVAIHL
jgi:hypothetical protein